MSPLWRMLGAVFGRKPVEPRGPEPTKAQDPEVRRTVADSHAKAARTNQLINELRSRTDLTRLERARIRYEERLHGTHGTRPS